MTTRKLLLLTPEGLTASEKEVVSEKNCEVFRRYNTRSLLLFDNATSGHRVDSQTDRFQD